MAMMQQEIEEYAVFEKSEKVVNDLINKLELGTELKRPDVDYLLEILRNSGVLTPRARFEAKLSKDAGNLTKEQVRYLVDTYYRTQHMRIAAQAQIRELQKETTRRIAEVRRKTQEDIKELEKLGRSNEKSLQNIYEEQERLEKQIQSVRDNDVLKFLENSQNISERNIQKILDKVTDTTAAGRWAKSIIGIGPVIAAGLTAYIDITKAQTVGAVWSFAGVDPRIAWHEQDWHRKKLQEFYPVENGTWRIPVADAEDIAPIVKRGVAYVKRVLEQEAKGTSHAPGNEIIKHFAKRPWNTTMKSLLCFIAGESFIKHRNNPKAVYGPIYWERKQIEIARNLNGNFTDQARETMATNAIGVDTDAYAWYMGCISYKDAHRAFNAIKDGTETPVILDAGSKVEGKDGEWFQGKIPVILRHKPGEGPELLPPARIHARARRYAVKLFVSHLHHVMYHEHFGKEPPKPYIFTRPEHTHFIQPPPPYPEILRK